MSFVIEELLPLVYLNVDELFHRQISELLVLLMYQSNCGYIVELAVILSTHNVYCIGNVAI